MAFQNMFWFICLVIEQFNQPFIITCCDNYSRSINWNWVCRIWTSIILISSFDHSHIPNLHYTIRITWSQHITFQRKTNTIDTIQVAIECLYTQTGFHIPQWDGFISWCSSLYIINYLIYQLYLNKVKK